MKTHYTKPSITDLEVQYVTDAAANGWGDRCYEYIEMFESKLRGAFDAQYAIATSSCTGALQMGLHALGLGRGDEVIMADTNWVATAAPVLHLGATPVLVDIEPDSWCIDPEAVVESLTPNTKAIVATHLYGNVADMERLQSIAVEAGVSLIEDAAEAIGSYWRERHVGGLGTFGVFSFHGSKTITTGEGGALVTDDPELHCTVLQLSNHGRSQSQMLDFIPDRIGYKYKISNVQAALGCAQFERFEELVQRKRTIFETYRSLLSDLPVYWNVERPSCQNGYWLPTIVPMRQAKFDRKGFINECRQQDIDVRPFFRPLSSMGAVRKKAVCRPNCQSEFAGEFGVNLPSYFDMTEQQQVSVSSTLKKFFA